MHHSGGETAIFEADAGIPADEVNITASECKRTVATQNSAAVGTLDMLNTFSLVQISHNVDSCIQSKDFQDGLVCFQSTPTPS